MARVDDYLDVLDEGSQKVLTPGHPADDALLALLVHMAFSDGVIDDEELSFLARVLPGRPTEALRQWVATVGSQPLDVQMVRSALTSEDERWKGLRFAARMAWKDGYLAVEEQNLLRELAGALELPDGAVERTLRETSPHRSFTAETIREAVTGLKWDSVQLARGDLCSPDLTPVVPEDTEAVVRVGVDNVEVMGLFPEGIAARFSEGPYFLRWIDIVAYTRGFGLAAGVTIHTEDGKGWTLVDARMNGVLPLLDRLFQGEEARKEKKPLKVEMLRGE